MKAVNDHLSLTLFTCPMIDTINCNCMGARTPQHPPFTSVTWVLVTDSGVLFGLIFVVGSLPCSKGFLPSQKPEFLNFTSVCHHCKFLFPFFSFFFFTFLTRTLFLILTISFFSDILRQHRQRYGGLSPSQTGTPHRREVFTYLSIFDYRVYGP